MIDINGNPITRNNEILVTYPYSNLDSYGFVGTCFDIIARLELIRYSDLYDISKIMSPNSMFERISQHVLLNKNDYEYKSLEKAKNQREIDLVRLSYSEEFLIQYRTLMINIQHDLTEFTEIKDNELVMDSVYHIFPSIYVLAKLEKIYRSGRFEGFKDIVDLYNQEFYLVDLDNLKKDLAYLYGIFRACFINNNLVSKQSRIVFNPTFGKASLLVGGADGDIIIDNTLYDFKCVKSNNYNENYWLQLNGYYFLNELSCKNTINKLGIFSARYGKFEISKTLPVLKDSDMRKIAEHEHMMDNDFIFYI